MRCRNEYNFGAFATNVAARNSPVVQVIRKVSDALDWTVNGIRTAVMMMIINPMLNRNPSCNFLMILNRTFMRTGTGRNMSIKSVNMLLTPVGKKSI